MALQTSGPISFADIAAEFGGSPPHSLSEYYGVADGVPSSGQISVDDFYGTANVFAFTISSNTSNANLNTLATSAGWDGSSPLEVTINSGVWLWASSTSNYGLIVNTPNTEIFNNGKIIGCGGEGGDDTRYGTTTVTGSNGGAALRITASGVTIRNLFTGYIAGGGGGGGASPHYASSSRAGGGGGAGGGRGGHGVRSNNGSGSVTPTQSAGGAGGSIGNSGASGSFGFSGGDNNGGGFGGGAGGGGANSEAHSSSSYTGSGGGGGGGRVLSGTGGAATTGSYTTGAGGSAGNAGGSGHAGGGGGWGAAGGTGNGGSGGSGGAAISKTTSYTLHNSGTVYGAT